MTSKYEILKAYKQAGHPEYIRDSWNNLGAAVAVPSAKTFVMDMLYKIDIPDCALDGGIVLCEASLYSPTAINWPGLVLEDEDNGYFSFTKGVITPHFRLLLTAEELAAITAPINPDFAPYTELESSILTISDQELEIIMRETGVPFITFEELEFPRNKIVNNMVWPALQEYYKYFPIIKRQVVNQPTLNGGTFEIEMPEKAYGVVRAQILQGIGGPSSGGNPMHFFANEIAWWGSGGGLGGTSPIRYNTGQGTGYANLQGFNTMALDRAARQGIINYATRVHTHIEKKTDGKKYLIGHCNRTGQLDIFWAMVSHDWDDVEFERLGEVRSLSAAYILRALGMLRSQVKTDIPGAMSFDSFINRAKELEDKVLTFWSEKPYAIAIRGSL